MDDSGSPEDATGQSAEPGLNLGGTPPSYPPPSFPPPISPPPPPGDRPGRSSNDGGVHAQREAAPDRPGRPVQDAVGARGGCDTGRPCHLLVVVDHLGVPARRRLRLPRTGTPPAWPGQCRLGGGCSPTRWHSWFSAAPVRTGYCGSGFRLPASAPRRRPHNCCRRDQRHHRLHVYR